MLPIHTILHPTDFSDPAEYALGLASALTRDYGVRLVVLHVYHVPLIVTGEGMLPPSSDEFREGGQARLNQLRVPCDDIRAERRLEEGDAATEILRVAAEIGANLIVMGTHGRTGLGRMLMGSVAEQVVRLATCPVLTVTAPFPRPVVNSTDAEVMAVAGPL